MTSPKPTWKLIIAGLLVVLPLLALAFRPQVVPATEGTGSAIVLQAPAFVSVAEAAPLQQQAAAAFVDTAGIAAYFEKADGIVINDDVRGIYRTIETEEGLDYIIGTVPVPNYGDNHDIHVYIHSDGWVVGYYLADIPTSKIIDWRAWDTETFELPTKLETVLASVGGTVGSADPTLTYYHFQYPDANRLTLAAEFAGPSVTDSFTLNIPSSFTYNERSWAFAVNGGPDTSCCANGVSTLSLNETEVTQFSLGSPFAGWIYSEGTLTAAQVPANATHTIETVASFRHNAYSGIAIVYEE